MRVVLMVIFVLSFVLGVLRAMADQLTKESSRLAAVVMILSFMGIMAIMFL